MSKYISVTDTAKLIRKDLKENFPGHTFSVRSESYAGGASINIYWFDGPTQDEVEAVTNFYVGSSFDSMTDYKSYVRTEFNGETVHFGSDHVFTRRYMSNDIFMELAQVAADEYDIQIPIIDFLPESRRYDKYQEMFEISRNQDNSVIRPDVEGRWRGYPNPSFYEIVSKIFQNKSFYKKPEKPQVKIKQTPSSDNHPDFSSDDLHCNIIYHGDWTWLDFNQKPSREILDKINFKGLGFRWGKKRMQWYKNEIIAQETIETELAGVTTTVTVQDYEG